jgi:opacity protein-like surface antigen
MIRKALSASAGLVVLAASSMPSLAGDWNNGAGTLKDRGSAAVPVPAPHLQHDGPSGWYMRLDVALGRQSNRGSKESGTVYGAGDAIDSFSANGAGFGSSAGWSNNGTEANFSYGGGVGYRWSSHWRSDVTLEHRTATEYKMRGTYQYNNMVANLVVPGNPYAPPAAVQQINGVSSDTLSMKSGVMLANTYYDWKNTSAFTPYVGFGVGLAYLDLKRQHLTSDTSCDPTTVPIPCAGPTAHRSFAASGEEDKLLWAGALTAGFSYAFTSVTSIDVNYRMLYIPTSTVAMSISGNNSQLSYNDIFEHQLRAGLRWDIN